MTVSSRKCDFGAANNEGVRLIQECRYDEAVRCFLQSMHLLDEKVQQRAMVYSNNETYYSNAPTYSTQSGGSFSYLSNSLIIRQDYLRVLSVSDMVSPATSYTPPPSCKHLLIFQNPVLLTPEAMSEEIQVHFFGGPLLTAILNNLALGYHLAALQNGCCIHRLKAAFTYYELSYRLLVRDEEAVLFQVMVVLNNLGQIHELLGNEESCRNCFKYLLASITFIQQSDQADRVSSFDAFVSNTIEVLVRDGSMTRRGINSAAAAA